MEERRSTSGSAVSGEHRVKARMKRINLRV